MFMYLRSHPSIPPPPLSLSPPPPSIEDAYRIDAEIDGEVVGLDILDTAGQEVFSAVRDRYMRDGEGFLLVYSLLERSTFVGITKISEQIKRVKDTDKHVPIILIGNKVQINITVDTDLFLVTTFTHGVICIVDDPLPVYTPSFDCSFS